ncbi:MAG TPA: hypothetical protein DCX92_03085, partial [Bacteroidetes bacterium]|nr:hypothetical protein [Bacteroidota bacterium]
MRIITDFHPVFAFIFFLTAVLFSAEGCSGDKIEPPKINITSADSIPSQESYNTTVTFSDSGKVKAILTAGRIRIFTKFNYTL